MSILDDLFGQSANTSADAMATAGVGSLLQAYGQTVSGESHLQAAQQQQMADEFQAAQLRIAGGQAQAAAQRNAVDTQRQTSYITSQAIATAAARGGGASDPSVVNTIAKISGESAYRQALDIYGGNQQAQVDELQAQGKELSGQMQVQQGQQLNDAAKVSSVATLMKGSASMGSLYQRFGGGGPTSISGDNSGGSMGSNSWGSP